MSRAASLAVLITQLLVQSPDARAARPKLAVLPVAIDASAKGQVPNVVDDYVLTAVHNLGLFEVIGQDDINSLLGFEKQKQVLGCDDASCFSQIGGALGVEKLLVVKIASLGHGWALTAKVIQITGEPRVLARETKVTADASAAGLLGGLEALVRSVFGQKPAAVAEPRPAPPLATSATPPARAPSPLPAATPAVAAEPAAPAHRGSPWGAVELRAGWGKFSPSTATPGIEVNFTELTTGVFFAWRIAGGLWVTGGPQWEHLTVEVPSASVSESFNRVDLWLGGKYVFGSSSTLMPWLGLELGRGVWNGKNANEVSFQARARGGLDLRLSSLVGLGASVFYGTVKATGDGSDYGVGLAVQGYLGE